MIPRIRQAAHRFQRQHGRRAIVDPRVLGMTRLLLALAFMVPVAQAQFDYYGPNKVQTRDYAWQSYLTEHFNILFYPGGEALAEFAAKSAEGYYRQIAKDLDADIDFRVPLILYLSPNQFAETNVITEVMEEGVGGFSELFKNRIAVPFNGSYHDLHHVIGHEITHIFEFQLFYRSRLSALLGAIGEFEMPLWVMEGFAEFQSGWTTVNSEIFMRDLVLNNRLVPLVALNDEYGYLAYREGESFFRYVEHRYGREKVHEFLRTLGARRNLGAAFTAVFGSSQEKFGEEWELWLRERYWPQVGRVSAANRALNRLTDHVRDGSVYNTAPALSPTGTKVAMVSDRSEYADCYVISAVSGDVLARPVRGGRSAGFENLHLLRPGVDWSPDEGTLAVVATSSGLDNLALVSYPSGRVKRRIQGSLDGIYAPRFSTDGRRLVFVGLKNGYSDIFTVPADGGSMERVTYDMYEDRDPAFMPDGRGIIYVSDRPDPGEEWQPGSYAVWLRDSLGTQRRLTGRSSSVVSPVVSSSGRFVFYAAADSAQNVYVMSLPEGAVVRRTSFPGEASHLSLSRDDRKLALAYYSNAGWDVALLLDPLDSIPLSGESQPVPAERGAFSKSGLDFERVRRVPFSLSVDYAAGAASYSSGAGGGLAGAVNVAFSDMLGNHRFAVYTDLSGDILNSDGVFQYWLLPYRLDYGFVAFQYRELPFYVPGSRYVTRLNRGGQVVAAWPFDRFTRVEAGLSGYASQVTLYRYDYSRGPGGWYVAGSWWERTLYGSAAFVLDNTLWTAHGPARGTRLRLEAGSSFLSDSSYQVAYADVRNYQRLGRRFVFASRLYSAGVFGSAAPFYLGGEVVRGYNWSEFYGTTGPGVALGYLELRYPFVDRLNLAFPLPIDLRGIRGVAFVDGGLVLRDGLRLWDNAQSRPADLKLGIGAGARIQISIFTLKLDLARPLSLTEDASWKFIFGLGTDF